MCPSYNSHDKQSIYCCDRQKTEAGSSVLYYNNNTFIDKENQYDTNVSVIKIKSSLWYQIIFIIKNA